MNNKFYLAALVLAIFATCCISCSKDEDSAGSLINITGTYRYEGNCPEIMDAKNFYDVEITSNTITTTPMFDDVKSTFNYTRSKNRISITPAINGKVSTATIEETNNGFGLRVSSDKILFFDKH